MRLIKSYYIDFDFMDKSLNFNIFVFSTLGTPEKYFLIGYFEKTKKGQDRTL